MYLCLMTTIEQPEVAALVRETRQQLKLSQKKFATLLSVSVHSVNRWENEQTCPLPLALKQIETLLHQMGEQGEDLLARYFEAREPQQ